MVKKIFVGIVITAVFGALILGGVNRALAKNDIGGTNVGNAELPNKNADAPSGTPEEKQNGECDGLNGDPLCNQEQEMVQEQHQYEYHNQYQYTTQQSPEGGNSSENAGLMQGGKTSNGKSGGQKGVQ